MKLKALNIKMKFYLEKYDIKKITAFQYKYFIQRKNFKEVKSIAFIEDIYIEKNEIYHSKILFKNKNIDISQYEDSIEFYLLYGHTVIGEGIIINTSEIYLA